MKKEPRSSSLNPPRNSGWYACPKRLYPVLWENGCRICEPGVVLS